MPIYDLREEIDQLKVRVKDLEDFVDTLVARLRGRGDSTQPGRPKTPHTPVIESSWERHDIPGE